MYMNTCIWTYFAYAHMHTWIFLRTCLYAHIYMDKLIWEGYLDEDSLQNSSLFRYMNKYMYIYMWKCLYRCTYIYIYINICIYIHLDKSIWKIGMTRTEIYIHIFTYRYICACSYIYIYIYIYLYVHINICILTKCMCIYINKLIGKIGMRMMLIGIYIHLFIHLCLYI
jgi:hypothetical protein